MTRSEKIISVIAGALATGFMWRARGSGGFGAFWGLTCVGAVLSLMLFSFYGSNRNYSGLLIPAGALMTGLTVFKCGSVVDLGGGVLIGDALFSGEETMRVTPVDEWRGILVTAVAGFALVCLFGIFAGTVVSEKKYGWGKYLVFIAVFFGVELIGKATFGHKLAELAVPGISAQFEAGLADRGIFMTAREAYLANFADIRWANYIPYGYPYYELVEHLCFFCSAVALILVAAFLFRDRRTALVSLGCDIAGAAAFVLGDYWNVNTFETSFLSKLAVPPFLRITDWGLWEYTVGFVLGFGIFLTLALAARTERQPSPQLPAAPGFVLTSGMSVFIFAVAPARAVGIRTGRLLENFGITDDNEPWATIVIIVLALIAGLVILRDCARLYYGKKHRIIAPEGEKDFAEFMFPLLFGVFAFAYFVLDDCQIVSVFGNPDFRGRYADFLPSLVSVAAVYVIYAARRIMKKKTAGERK